MRNDDIEGKVERYLRVQVERRGGRCVKFNSVRGYPDRIVMLPGGILFWVETKRPVGGVVADAQKVQHVKLRRLGQTVYVLKNEKEIDEVLEQYPVVP